jgi:hypothetical protein
VSINIHAIANAAIQVINPDIDIILRRSSGFTLLPDGSQTPLYEADLPIKAQVQVETPETFRQSPTLGVSHERGVGLAVQPIRRSVYIAGVTNGIDRGLALGGDLMIFPEFPGQADRIWLVTQVQEPWNGVWTRCVVTLQDGTP